MAQSYTPHDGTDELFARSVVDIIPHLVRECQLQHDIRYTSLYGGADWNSAERSCVSVPCGRW